MGQGQSCSELNEFKNACEMYNCVNDVNGLSSNSASPTDTWIVTFESGTRYEEEYIHKGFIKFFIDPGMLPPTYGSMDILNSLKYEIQIYRDIVRPLIDQQICPNFVRYLGSGANCNFDSMMNILEGKTKSLDGYLKNRDELERSFALNVHYMRNTIPDRPSINKNTDPKHVTQAMIDISKTLTYNLLVNKPFSPGTGNLSEWFENNLRHGQRMTKLHWGVVFQAIAGCYALSLSKTVHNDLHHGNVWIEQHSNPINYIIGQERKGYSVRVGYKALIYDFDRAYCTRIGHNSILENFSIKNASQSNEFIPNKDMVKFFAYLYLGPLVERDKLIILDILSKPGNSQWLSSVYKSKNGTFLQKPNGYAVTAQEFETRLNSAEHILKRVGELSQAEVLDKNEILNDVENLYVCIPQIFNSSGKVSITTKSHDYIVFKSLQQAQTNITDVKDMTRKIQEESYRQVGKVFEEKMKYQKGAIETQCTEYVNNVIKECNQKLTKQKEYYERNISDFKKMVDTQFDQYKNRKNQEINFLRSQLTERQRISQETKPITQTRPITQSIIPSMETEFIEEYPMDLSD